MEKRIFVIGFFVFCMSFLSGCSMMPSDEEIIKGSVLETEIFGDELVDDGLDEDEIINEFEEDDNLENENDSFMQDEEGFDGNNVVDIEVL